jgi:hypothetical protein
MSVLCAQGFDPVKLAWHYRGPVDPGGFAPVTDQRHWSQQRRGLPHPLPGPWHGHDQRLRNESMRPLTRAM